MNVATFEIYIMGYKRYIALLYIAYQFITKHSGLRQQHLFS